MPEQSNNPSNFWQELKRRKVIRVITVYAAAAFVILELVDIVSPSLGLPSWTLNMVIVLLCIGFIISIIFSWVYDITPEGVQKTKHATQVSSEAEQATPGGWKVATYVSALIIIAFVVFYTVSNIKQSSDISKLEKSIAVLPFENFSVEEEYSHMGDAITDEIILELQKIKEFDRVLSRSSTMQYKDNRPTIPEMAEKLGVNYLIEGSIQRHGEDVSIRVQVIRAKNEDHVWGDKFEGDWKDILSIQDNIAKEIANKLKVVLSPLEIEKIDKKPTDNLEAYNLYLKGRFLWEERTKEAQLKSVEYFEMSVASDPEYALAYAGLADAYYIIGWYGWLPRSEAYSKAKEFAFKALKFDNDLVEAHNTLGALYCWSDWNWEMAKKEFILAIGMNQSYASAHHYYSEFLDMMGYNEEAREQINIALELDPYVLMFLKLSSFYYYHEGSFEKALEVCKKMQEVDEEYVYAYWWAFNIYIKQGEDLKAVEELQKIMSLDTLTIEYTNLVKKAYDKSGINGIYKFLIDLQLDQSKPFASLDTDKSMVLARWYTAIGSDNEALYWLEQALNDRPPGIPRLHNDPGFVNLHAEPRFQTILKELKF